MSLFALLGADADDEVTEAVQEPPEEGEDDLLNELEDALGGDATAPPSVAPSPDRLATPAPEATPGAAAEEEEDDEETEDDVDDIIEDMGPSKPPPAAPAHEDDDMDGEPDALTTLTDPVWDAERRAAANVELLKKRESKIVARFSAIQMERYESYRRSRIDKKNIRRIGAFVVGHPLSDQVCTVLCSMTKMYVGEVVETARIIAHRGGHRGALMPIHIHEAYQLMRARDRVPNSRQFARLFR